MTTGLVDPMVAVQLTGTPEQLMAQLRTIDILSKHADMMEREALGEGYHGGRPDQSETVQVSAAIDPDAIPRPVDDLPILLLSWVPEARIDAGHRAFVRRHVNRAAKQLDLDGPSIPIRWFGPAVGEPDFWTPAYREGYAPSGVTPDDAIGGVAFNKGIRGDALVGIIAHEVRHLKQNEMRRRLEDRSFAEGDADDFAAAYLAGTDK